MNVFMGMLSDLSWSGRRSHQRTEAHRNLSEHACAFVTACEARERSMRTIVDELQDVAAAVQHVRRQVDGVLIAGFVLFVVGLCMAGSAMKDTKGWSFVLAALLTWPGLVYVIYVGIKWKVEEYRQVSRMKALWRRFVEEVGALRGPLNAMKTVCGVLRTTSDGAAALSVSRLEINILELFFSTCMGTAAANRGDAPEAALRGARTLDDLVRMKRDLQVLYMHPNP